MQCDKQLPLLSPGGTLDTTCILQFSSRASSFSYLLELNGHLSLKQYSYDRTLRSALFAKFSSLTANQDRLAFCDPCPSVPSCWWARQWMYRPLLHLTWHIKAQLEVNQLPSATHRTRLAVELHPDRRIRFQASSPHTSCDEFHSNRGLAPFLLFSPHTSCDEFFEDGGLFFSRFQGML